MPLDFIMESVTDEEIIKKAKEIIKTGDVALLWLIGDHFGLRKDVNRAQQIANRMTRGIRYEIFKGHNPDDIFVRQRADYIPKMVGLIAIVIGVITTLLKLL